MEGRDCACRFSSGRGLLAGVGGTVLWAVIVDEVCRDAISGRVA